MTLQREPPPKPANRLDERRKFKRAQDSLQDYIRRASQRAALGYIPSDQHLERDADSIVLEARERTLKVIDALTYGPRNRDAMIRALTGLSRGQSMHIITGKSLNPNRNLPGAKHHAMARDLRLLQTSLLSLICGLKEELTDFERDLWVALQLTHDPRIQLIKKHAEAKVKGPRGKPGRPRKADAVRRLSDETGVPARQIRRQQINIVLPPRLVGATPQERETEPAHPAAYIPRDSRILRNTLSGFAGDADD